VGLALLAVLLVGINLRSPIAAVAPVLDEIGDDVGLTRATAGLLTSLPVVCFALAAPLAAWVGHRTGPARAIALGLVVVAVGLVARVLLGSGLLLVGTVVVGLGMTVGNVLVPVVIKRDFPLRAARVTGIYTATLAGGAALAAGLTAPMSEPWGWRVGLAAWAVLPVVALLVWWPGVVVPERAASVAAARAASARTEPVHPGGVPHTSRSVWRQPMAWAVGLTLGFQSALYYSLTSWLPTLLREDLGLAREAAGTAMSVFQLLAIPATLVVPVLCRRRPTQSWIGALVALGWTVMVLGLLVVPQWWLLWCVVGALAQGSGISLAFTLAVLRARDAEAVRGLSGMSQLIGYGLGAAGPIALGAVSAATGSWDVPLLVLLVLAGGLLLSAVTAGRDRVIV
jgi:CP family cyanate transporter-like MFS transporter